MHVPGGMMLSVDSCLRWWLGPVSGEGPGNHLVGGDIARDLFKRGLVRRAELRGRPGKRLLAECAAAGVLVVVERESMGIKWVRFEKAAP